MRAPSRRPRLTTLLGVFGATAALVGLACAQIIGADADVVECTVEQADRCNDGNACTNDSCTRGRCFHDQIATCGISCASPADCDDGIPCTEDICYERSECRHAPKKDCEAACTTAEQCDDGSKCTTDQCVEGKCRNDAIDCTALDGPCTKGVCSPVSGECTSDPCDTAVDPVTCSSFVCDPMSQQCQEILCADDGTNPCITTSCIGGACTPNVVEFQPLGDTNPNDCVYDVYCDAGGAPIFNAPADYEIPADDGDLETVEYCHNGRNLSCSRGTFLQPVCEGCTTAADCPEIPCQTLRECDGTTCRYDAIDNAPHPSFCNMCSMGGCEVGNGITCWPMEPVCCDDNGVCCGPNGCRDGAQMDLDCGACGGATECSFPVCLTNGGTCATAWQLEDDMRCSGGTCIAGECQHF